MGYDKERFLDQIQQCLICEMCNQVSQETRSCSVCSLSICFQCLITFQVTCKNICPIKGCKAPKFIEIDPNSKKQMRQLMVRCMNYKKGCNIKCCLENIQNHEAICGFTEVQCNNCGCQSQKQFQNQHNCLKYLKEHFKNLKLQKEQFSQKKNDQSTKALNEQNVKEKYILAVEQNTNLAMNNERLLKEWQMLEKENQQLKKRYNEQEIKLQAINIQIKQTEENKICKSLQRVRSNKVISTKLEPKINFEKSENAQKIPVLITKNSQFKIKKSKHSSKESLLLSHNSSGNLKDIIHLLDIEEKGNEIQNQNGLVTIRLDETERDIATLEQNGILEEAKPQNSTKKAKFHIKKQSDGQIYQKQKECKIEKKANRKYFQSFEHTQKKFSLENHLKKQSSQTDLLQLARQNQIFNELVKEK